MLLVVNIFRQLLLLAKHLYTKIYSENWKRNRLFALNLLSHSMSRVILAQLIIYNTYIVYMINKSRVYNKFTLKARMMEYATDCPRRDFLYFLKKNFGASCGDRTRLFPFYLYEIHIYKTYLIRNKAFGGAYFSLYDPLCCIWCICCWLRRSSTSLDVARFEEI